MELLKAPGAVGLKVTLIVQDLFWATGAEQPLVSEKGAPGCETLEITRDAVPVFLRTTDFVEVFPTARFPKFRLVRFKDTAWACRCVAEPKSNKQRLANANGRVKPLISHLCNPAISLRDAPGEIPLVLQSVKGGQNGSWDRKYLAKTTNGGLAVLEHAIGTRPIAFCLSIGESIACHKP